LEKYDFDSLRKEYLGQIRGSARTELEILGEINEVEERRKAGAQGIAPVRFDTSEIRFQSDGKWVSGMINYFPEKSSLSPIIIMVRGYAEKEGYYPGSGSWKVADELAMAGFATISLDFLGYGHSDVESNDMLEARFHKVVEVLDLLEAVKQMPWVDQSKIGFWAHSNGGQIVMSVLEITGVSYPTVMWAPMTQPFPDSVLSTIDKGSPVKEALDDFMKHYDTRRYAFENYYHWINSPILIQQGTADDQVKVEWQRGVFGELGELGKQVELEIYPGADHNLKGSWQEAVEKAIIFFKR
jgi:dipeptidyl aminopeptidase/acylaminoacyl peptidase